MKKYTVAQLCAEELRRLDTSTDDAHAHGLLRERALAVATAVDALSKLQQKEVRNKLREHVEQENEVFTIHTVVHNTTFLKNSDPPFWSSCFVRLFPRGDCAERCSERAVALSPARWVCCLLTRADAPQWRTDVEFIATLYNVFLRRDQMRAVETSFRSPFLSTAALQEMEKLTAGSLVAHALSSGDVDSVKELLRRKNLEKPIEATFRHMQIVQRNVRGSEAEKDKLMPKFLAMRIWSGCSSLFFTLNPHDIRSPLTISILQSDTEFKNEFSFVLNDAAAEQ